MQQWLDLIPIAGTLLNLAADMINLATALIIGRDAAQARKTTPSHPRATESAILAEPGEAAPIASDGQPADR